MTVAQKKLRIDIDLNDSVISYDETSNLKGDLLSISVRFERPFNTQEVGNYVLKMEKLTTVYIFWDYTLKGLPITQLDKLDDGEHQLYLAGFAEFSNSVTIFVSTLLLAVLAIMNI